MVIATQAFAFLRRRSKIINISFDSTGCGAYDAPFMLTEPIPNSINPAQMAAADRILAGQIPQRELLRFSAYLAETSGTVAFKLRFKKQRDGNVHITGGANTTVAMVCQYCLEPVKLAVNASIAQVVVSNEAEIEDFRQDILVVEGETIELASIIEDDLILSLPMVATHAADQIEENGDCLDRLEYEQQDEDSRSSPFAVLKQLKVNKPVD
ncbi:MAG: YceD family protein [Gammaproteobacteria bacterium]|nr:YceD family protein [Gammaproteobacteria bacterium]